MPDRISLLDEIRKGGYEASLITTFNAYLPFYEEVVLRRLMNAGMRHNVLMMDADQYGLSLEHHPPKLAGRQYTLVPIGMPGAFHPKLFFLAGKSKGLVIVGSHNMTLAGFGFNRELTNVVRITGTGDKAGISLAAQAWRAVTSWVQASSTKVPSQISEMVNKVRDFAPWLSDAEEADIGDERLLIGLPGEAPLWDQLLGYLGDRKASQVAMTGAFFDSKLAFVKRVQEDLDPTNFSIALDPKTVQMPALFKNTPSVNYVKGDALAHESQKAESAAHYLHAKGLYIQTEEGGSAFVSGSANPSSPAWLVREGFGNAELMLARFGIQAREVAGDMGFLSIDEMPPLSEEEWTAIASAWQDKEVDAGAGRKAGVAVVEGDRVIVDSQLMKNLKQGNPMVIGQDGVEIASANEIIAKTDHTEVVFTEDQLSGAHFLRFMEEAEVCIELLLHHAGLVAEQARTGIQKRFKDALQSLETDTPDIGMLIECIDKIVFSDASTASQVAHHVRASKKGADEDSPDPGTLAIDMSETRRQHSKKRLEHTGDFGYLLDALIYHLRVHEDKSVESLDQLGRSEEEQVGADDDEDAESELLSEPRRIELLEYCHNKVRLVVNRMISQLQSYVAGKKTIAEVLVRLLGVLAVFRELRRCDGRVAWVDKGKTTVPQEERYRLFEEIMFTLFEGDTSLLHLEALGEEFEHSDDIARLKGLLVWLAWDCGLTLSLHKPFMESAEQQHERFKHNAMMLALAQTVRNDDVVIDEARQSIGGLSSSEMDWLVDLRALITQCDAVKARSGSMSLTEGSEARPGDVAVHKKLENWDLRVVLSNSGNQVSLIKLSKKKENRSFSAEYLMTAKLDAQH